MQQRTRDSKREAATLYLAGQSTYAIAETFGKTDTTIRNWLDALGIPRRSDKEAARLRELEHGTDRATMEQAVALYLAGSSDAEIAERFNVTAPTVRGWRLKLGVTSRPRSESARLARARRDAPLVAKLLENAGRCGSPTCTDPGCHVAPGQCHREGCDRPATVARQTLLGRRWVRGRPAIYCDSACAAADVTTWAETASEDGRKFEQWCADNGYWTRDQAVDFLMVSDSAIEYYEARGYLVPVERRKVGVRPPRPAYRPQDVKRAGRTMLERARLETHHFFNPQYALRWAGGKGLSATEAADLLTRIEERQRRYKGVRVNTGRPKGSGPPEHHYEWAALFRAIMDEYTETYELHHVAGDKPPTDWEVSRLVAYEDYERHPERWDYVPTENPRNAGARVWGAVKPLLSALTETPT